MVLNVFGDIQRAVDSDGMVILTLLDLSAVLDTVDRATLLCRLYKSNGHSGVIRNWFTYLDDSMNRFIVIGSAHKLYWDKIVNQ